MSYLQPKIERENRDMKTKFSSYCPYCGDTRVKRSDDTPNPNDVPFSLLPSNHTSDFDEKGWYLLVEFTCLNKKCEKTWKEKLRT